MKANKLYQWTREHFDFCHSTVILMRESQNREQEKLLLGKLFVIPSSDRWGAAQSVNFEHVTQLRSDSCLQLQFCSL